MLIAKDGYVYIMTNSNHTVLYTGVTNDIKRRVEEHRTRAMPGSFTWKYNCTKLVYYCGFPFIAAAIAEEKRLKAGNRRKKIQLIEEMNPEWKDLWEEVSGEQGMTTQVFYVSFFVF